MGEKDVRAHLEAGLQDTSCAVLPLLNKALNTATNQDSYRKLDREELSEVMWMLVQFLTNWLSLVDFK